MPPRSPSRGCWRTPAASAATELPPGGRNRHIVTLRRHIGTSAPRRLGQPGRLSSPRATFLACREPLRHELVHHSWRDRAPAPPDTAGGPIRGVPAALPPTADHDASAPVRRSRAERQAIVLDTAERLFSTRSSRSVGMDELVRETG